MFMGLISLLIFLNGFLPQSVYSLSVHKIEKYWERKIIYTLSQDSSGQNPKKFEAYI